MTFGSAGLLSGGSRLGIASSMSPVLWRPTIILMLEGVGVAVGGIGSFAVLLTFFWGGVAGVSVEVIFQEPWRTSSASPFSNFLANGFDFLVVLLGSLVLAFFFDFASNGFEVAILEALLVTRSVDIIKQVVIGTRRSIQISDDYN